MRSMRIISAMVITIIAIGVFTAFLAGPLTSHAVQNPSMSIDMDPTGNTYTGSPTNSMTVGTIDNCLTTIPGDPGTDIGNGYLEHDHFVDLVIQNVEDMVGWQARLNYIGDKMTIAGFNDKPFLDQPGNVPVGFVNLPKAGIAASTHRGTVPASNIPAIPPDGSNTPQTALIGSVYNGAQNFPISPDTPPKGAAEPTTNASAAPLNATPNYSAPTGGVLASLQLTVIGDESAGNQLFMDLDDGIPNPPPSAVNYFDGAGLTTIDLTESALGDGFHGEGVTCTIPPTPTPTPTLGPPTPTPTPCPECTPTPSPPPTSTPGPAPANDNLVDAIAIGALPFTDSQSTLGATNEPGEPSPCVGISNAVWYTFTPSLDGALEANTIGSSFDTALAVYRGTSLDNLTFVACNDDAVGVQSRIRFLSHQGETIYFQAGGYFGSRGNLVFNLLDFTPPPNDDFPGSAIANLPFTATQNTASATFESGEPSPCAPFGATVWYSFTPAADMRIAADTFGSDFGTAVAAYTGTSLLTLTPVACSPSSIVFPATAGTTYYFQVGGFFGQTGNLVFNLDLAPPPLEIAVSIAPDGSVFPRDGKATVHGTITCSKPALVQLSGELSQQSGRATISGFFFTSVPCQGEAFWHAEVEGENGPFAGGRADLSVSAFAFAEGEFDSAEASGTVVLKGTRPPSSAGCPRTGNDGFELGVVDTNVIPCWTVVDQEGGYGSWCNKAGTAPPQGDCAGSFAPVAAPPEGLQAAMTNQGGFGSHVLYRCGVLRSGQVSFQLEINNQAFGFSSPPSLDFTVFPNQQFRADLLTAVGVAADPFTVAPADVLLNLYQTLPGDLPVSGYSAVTADASAYVGQEVCLRFAEVDNQFFFNAGVDHVSIDLRRRR